MRQTADQEKISDRGHHPLLLGSMILMIASLFISRAALSVSMMVFVLVSFFHRRPLDHFRNFISTPFYWVISLLLLVPIVSGIWSTDSNTWLKFVIIKLPLLFLPLAFAGPPFFKPEKWEIVAVAFILFLTAGTVWSIFHYSRDFEMINEGYLEAKSIITPLENDHVRFSWLVSIAIFTCWKLIRLRRSVKWVVWTLGIVSAWLIIYLHVLAARTGILSFYLGTLFLATWLIIHNAKMKIALALFALVMLIPVAAYHSFPSFQNKLKYFRYEFDFFKNADYRPGYNDNIRVISMRAGWNIMVKNAALGVGYGDILKETERWYGEQYPQMTDTDRIYPSSCLLMYGSGCGIPGALVFLIAMILPFFSKVRDRMSWWLICLVCFFSLLFDIGLDIQFGVFAWCFVLLWWRGWLKAEKN